MSLSLSEYEMEKRKILKEIMDLYKAKRDCASDLSRGEGSLSMLNQIFVLTSQIDDRLERLFYLESCLP